MTVPMLTPAQVPVHRIEPRAASVRLSEFDLVDVREPSEYAAGHVPGARLVPLATLARAAEGWDRRRPVLVVCQSGGRSARAAALLASMGFTSVSDLVGGTSGWRAAGLPVSHGRA